MEKNQMAVQNFGFIKRKQIPAEPSIRAQAQ